MILMISTNIVVNIVMVILTVAFGADDIPSTVTMWYASIWVMNIALTVMTYIRYCMKK